MKKIVLIAVCLFNLQFLVAQEPIDKANYAQAAKFSPDRLKKMVFSLDVNPHWLKESDRFWYMYKTTEGVFYYLVDPARKSKTLLFDNAKMAADMSRLTGDPFDAQHLFIENLKFINRETALRFEVKSKLVEEEAEAEKQENEQDQQRTRKPGKMPVVGLRGATEVLVEQGADGRLGLHADELFHDLSVADEHDGRDAADAEMAGEALLLVGIDLGKDEPAAVVVGDAVEHGHERAARPAPRSPEVDQHGRGR